MDQAQVSQARNLPCGDTDALPTFFAAFPPFRAVVLGPATS